MSFTKKKQHTKKKKYGRVHFFRLLILQIKKYFFAIRKKKRLPIYKLGGEKKHSKEDIKNFRATKTSRAHVFSSMHKS